MIGPAQRAMAQWRALSPSGRVGAVMILVYVLVGILGPLVAPYSPTAFDPTLPPERVFQAPSGAHWLGTDKNGIDILSQLLWGARGALVLSSTVVFISAALGVMLGASAGYLRGMWEALFMRVTEILMAFPGILLNIAIVALVSKPGLGVLIGALVVNGWVGYARVARGQALSLRERDFVTAARALGASRTRIITRHIIPNLLAPVMVQVSFGVASVILVEASLSFLGLGAQRDYMWGAMLDQGATFGLVRRDYWWYPFIPGLAIMWVVLGANLLGDGLRDRLDPKARRRT